MSRTPLRILAAALALFCSPAAASPSIFVVSDADTTIYLFGTIHSLDEGDWFNGDVRQAFDRSSELVEEALLPGPSDRQPTLRRAAMPLPLLLTEAERARLRQVAGARFDRFNPWVAWMVLQGEAFGRAGYSSELGADAVLVWAARARGMRIEGLETVEQQIAILEGLPSPEQLDLLRRTLHDPEEGVRALRVAIECWRRGDADAAASAFNGVFGPAAYGRLTVARNIAWAEWVRNRLAAPGTVFVAVGAAHLGGPDSVQAQLAARGIVAHRVAPAILTAR